MTCKHSQTTSIIRRFIKVLYNSIRTAVDCHGGGREKSTVTWKLLLAKILWKYIRISIHHSGHLLRACWPVRGHGNNNSSPVNLTSESLDCGRKPEYSDETASKPQVIGWGIRIRCAASVYLNMSIIMSRQKWISLSAHARCLYYLFSV